MQSLTWDEFAAKAPRYCAAVAHPLEFAAAWELPQGMALLIDLPNEPQLLIEGSAEPLDYVRLLTAASDIGLRPQTATVPTSLAETLSLPTADRWLWMWRESPLRSLPQNCEVVATGVADAEIQRFLQLAAPHSSAAPGDVELEFWVLHRDDAGAIDACAGGKRWRSGEAVVVSVATAAESRRQGLGKSVTQVAVSEFFTRGDQRVSLGVGGNNLGAQALYRQLGFEQFRDFTTFSLAE